MSDTEKKVETVKALINRATSPDLEEARSAAYMACKLIRQHGLDIVDPEAINEVYDQLAVAERKLKLLEAEPARPAQRYPDINWGVPLYDPSFKYKSPPAPDPAPAMGSPIELTSKYDGACKQCRKPYKVGDRIRWQKGVGQWCDNSTCYPAWVRAQQPGHGSVDLNDLFGSVGKP